MAAQTATDTQRERSLKMLLVEDNPGDVRLVQESLREAPFLVQLSVAWDGQMALDMLALTEQEPGSGLPDLILLDLNLPLRSGHEVLMELKSNSFLKRVPVVIFSTSDSTDDIVKSYQNHANCYVNKPGDFEEYLYVTRKMFDFWLSRVEIPGKRADSK